MVPRPAFPNTPEECASSTIMMAPCRSAASANPGSGPMSPSIEKTPSEISSFLPETPSSSASIFAAAATSLCGNTWIFALESRHPSMMLAWFNILECGDALFQLHVQRHGPGNRAHRARSHAEAFHRLDCGFNELGMRG